MQSNIEIKFLSASDMKKARDLDWRYEHVSDDNLGFADKKKNRVYVRAGLDRELTKYLVDHEVSHLFELEGTDEDEHGIRHKKGGGFWRIAVPIVLSVLGAAVGGPALGALGSSLGTGLGATAGTALGGATGTALGGGIGSAAGGILGSAAGAGLGGFGGNALGQSITGKPNWGSSIGAGLTGGMSGVGGLAGQGAMTGLSSLISQRPSYGNMFQPSSQGGFSGSVPSPNTFGSGFSMSGGTAPSGVGSGTQGGGIGLQSNVGTGQAGITLGAQRGIDNVNTGGQQQGQPNMDNMFGFNSQNEGLYDF